MSDFDEVLERLVTDPVFQVALRADPEEALRGYRLEPEERELLDAQLDLGSGADHLVEDRISKSGLFGLVGPVVSGLGLGAAAGPPAGTPVFGELASRNGVLSGVSRDDPSDVVATLGETPPEGHGVLGTVGGPPVTGSTATDYHTWVDADGDGQGDMYRAVERGDGGVDIYVDQDGDRVVDFIGHDYDRDGLVDNADYDTDHDGLFDRRMEDIDGDGWLDRSLPYPTQSKATFGTTGEPGENT
jgi:hypothetical protein